MIDFEEEMNRMIKVLISHEQELKERNLLTSELVAKSTNTQVRILTTSQMSLTLIIWTVGNLNGECLHSSIGWI